MTPVSRVLVVGGSVAGLRAAEAIRRAGFTGRLSLLSAEKHFPPVDRPPLSKQFLLSGGPAPRLRAAPGLDVELVLGRAAVALAPGDHQVSLDDGSVIDYDGLVIATGARAVQLPGTAGFSNVHVLRTLEDAAGLRAALRQAARVAVIGAGVLGCEVAATCRQLGLAVTLIDTLEAPMIRALGEPMARVARELHQAHGVTLRLGHRVLGFHGGPKAEGVVLVGADVVPADVIVVAVGVRPDTAWLEHSGLELADGVVCDSECFALGGGQAIVAAGDVARWHHPGLRRSVRVEHWTNAVAQGQAAGRNLAAALQGGEPQPYAPVPYFWSDQYDSKLQFLGLPGGEASDEETEPTGGRVVAAYRTDGRVTGVLCVNWPARVAHWRARLAAEAG